MALVSVRSLSLLLALGAVAAAAAAAEDAPAPNPRSAELEQEATAVETPPSKFVEEAQEALAEMRTNMSKGLDEIGEARQAKDALLLTCVNEWVTAMKGIMRVSEQAFVDLQEAQVQNDTETARREFRKIMKAHRKMDDLYTAAVNCAGGGATSTDSQVEMIVEEGLAELDPYYGDEAFFFDPQVTTSTGTTGTVGGQPDQPLPPASGVTG